MELSTVVLRIPRSNFLAQFAIFVPGGRRVVLNRLCCRFPNTTVSGVSSVAHVNQASRRMVCVCYIHIYIYLSYIEVCLFIMDYSVPEWPWMIRFTTSCAQQVHSLGKFHHKHFADLHLPPVSSSQQLLPFSIRLYPGSGGELSLLHGGAQCGEGSTPSAASNGTGGHSSSDRW